MSNLEVMKGKLIEKIQSFSEKELHQFLVEIECIKDTLEVMKLFPDNLFYCEECRKKYGDCEDDKGEADYCLCEQRFIRFCKEQVEE